jgi:hypothetical protein
MHEWVCDKKYKEILPPVIKTIFIASFSVYIVNN